MTRATPLVCDLTTDALGGWPHKLSAFPGRRVTISTGPFRVALRLPVEFSPTYGWHDPPGLPATLTLDFKASSSEPCPDAAFTAWSPAELELRGKYADGHIDFGAGRGHFTIRTGVTSPESVLIGGVLEAAMAALLHQLTMAGGLMLHAASLQLGGAAHVVFGHSGAGKTTLAERLPTAFLNEEYAFLIPTEGGWRWLWYPQSRAPKEARPAELPLGRLLAMSTDRTQTRVAPMAAVTDVLPKLMGSVFWLPGMPGALLLKHCAALIEAHPVAALSHCLRTPAAQVAALIAGEEDELLAI